MGIISGAVGEGLSSIRGLLGIENLEDIKTGFKFGYIVEIYDLSKSAGNDLVASHVFTMNPTSYNLSEPFQATLTPTEDNKVVAEENGIIVRELVIEGTFGLKLKTASGWAGNQGGPASGNAHFLHLRKMFRKYGEAKQDPNKAADIQMVWHSLREDDHFIVVPRMFETPRDANTRVHYNYRISMTAIGEGRSPRRSTDPLTMFDDAVRDVGEAFNDTRSFFAQVEAQIEELKRPLRSIEGLMTNVAHLINAMGSFVRATTSFVPEVRQMFITAATNIEQAAEDLDNALLTDPFRKNVHELKAIERGFNRSVIYQNIYKEEAIPGFIAIVGTAYDGERALTNNDIEDQTAGADIGSRTRAGGGSSSFNGIQLTDVTAVDSYMLSRVDSITSLASKFLTTPETIIMLNNLKPPYITPTGGPGIKQPGDTILIPVANGDAATSMQPNNDYQSNEEILFGTDLALDAALLKQGYLDLKVNTTGDDADLVSGVPNVTQGLGITLNTELGSSVYVPTLGIRRNAGTKGTLNSVLLASIAFREAILSDPRVEDIKESAVVLDSDVLQQEITPILTNGRKGTTLITPFGTASGEGA